MRALVSDLSLTRVAATVGQRWARKDAAWQPGGILQMRDIAVPDLPGDEWVRLRPRQSGVCGTDLKLLHVGLSPIHSAFNPNSRSVLGHEIVADVEAVGAKVKSIKEGDTVLVEPTLHCRLKGLPPCSRCQAGDIQFCENGTVPGNLCSGWSLGFVERLSGGWSEALVAHESMLWPVNGIAATRGVLAEPLAVALHAVDRWQGSGERALVIGPGSIGLLVIAALRSLHPQLDITVVGTPADEAGRNGKLAAEFGADRLWGAGGAALLEKAADFAAGKLLHPRFPGLPVLEGGFDVVFDCITTPKTVDISMRLLRAGGEMIMVGTAGREKVDWSLVWWRELSIRGTLVYGREVSGKRTFAAAREMLEEKSLPFDSLITHRFALDDYRQALDVADAASRAGAIKVVFEQTPK